MNITKILKHQIRSKIKRLYKKYDQHLDRITRLDSLIDDENIKMQQCFHYIKEYCRHLNKLM